MRNEYIRTRPQPIAVELFFKCAEQMSPDNKTKFLVASVNNIL